MEWLAMVLGVLPLLGYLLWWWNELRYVVPLKLRDSATTAKLPPGHMGFPVLGEMLTFLWYFKVVRRPDEFINAKRKKYGDGVGMYRTHLFGSPSIIACFPPVSKFVLQSDNNFLLEWPNVDLMGPTSLVAVHGKAHARLRSYVINAINRPDALRRIAVVVQPRIVAALNSWSQNGTVKAYHETKKVTFENIGKLFASLEPGPLLNTIDELIDGLVKGVRAQPFNMPGSAYHRARQVTFENIGKLFASLEPGPLLNTIDELIDGLVKGVRAQPFNMPGSAYHRARQCRKKLDAIFTAELEKKKNQIKVDRSTSNDDLDLMDGLMQIEDDEGNKLSDQEVIDNIVSLAVAGYVSTSLASMWAIYYLAKYPNVLKMLREENMAIIRNKTGDFITSDDVSKLTYTNKVVEETIRMANVTVFLFRLATNEVEYKGYKIPKGWKVILLTRYFHTNPENFEDPMCFNPDRWNEPAKPGTYQVFGGGPRLCAGNMLAKIQLSLFLHHLSTKYKWELPNPDAGIAHLPHQKPVDGVDISFSKI
ncbi:Cytochrome P450 [Trema orientale]|uniref:Cytochrome P450 n=1 Tax=Trema orientale TaxID=63057 RepID=A0A2P5EKM4_TREOI|nr:Cytochrome P450 [Trema orientale]